MLDKARRKAGRRLKRAGDDVQQLHQARKSVKRLRYAGELLADLVPKAGKFAKAAKKQQTVLGDHQDLVVAADFLQRQGAQDRQPGRAQPGSPTACCWPGSNSRRRRSASL